MQSSLHFDVAIKESEVDSAKNASGTQCTDTPPGYRTPGVLRLGVVYRETVSRYTVINEN